MVLDALDVDAVRRWSALALDLLETHCAQIDALNVFPVADSDTGSNALATLRAADAALRDAPSVGSAPDALAALADGAARAALGNSGFIVSQILRGLAEAGDTAPWDAAALAAGLRAGTELAHAAVVTPVAGTILTVADAAASSAEAEKGTGAAFGDVVGTAVRAADAALQRTPEQLPALARAGVVDAGGRVLVLLLAALAGAVTGVVAPTTPVQPLASPLPVDAGGLGFEVQYRLEASPDRLDSLRAALSRLGDSVAVVATGAGDWNVHVHVDDVGAAVEAGVQVGRPYEIRVVPLAVAPAGDVSVAVLAVAPGAGLAHLFESTGVDGVHVVEGGADDLPAVDDVVAAVHGTGAGHVVLLPNASRVSGVAEAAAERARAAGVAVAVVPTRSAVQGLAAVAVHDAGRRFDDDVVAMAEAAAATRYAEIDVAEGEGLTAVGICHAGDVLGMIDGEVVQIGAGVLPVAFTLVDRLLAVGAELMTVLVGAQAPPRAGALIAAHVRGRAPFTDVSVYDAGQPDYPVVIGVE